MKKECFDEIRVANRDGQLLEDVVGTDPSLQNAAQVPVVSRLDGSDCCRGHLSRVNSPPLYRARKESVKRTAFSARLPCAVFIGSKIRHTHFGMFSCMRWVTTRLFNWRPQVAPGSCTVSR